MLLSSAGSETHCWTFVSHETRRDVWLAQQELRKTCGKLPASKVGYWRCLRWICDFMLVSASEVIV